MLCEVIGGPIKRLAKLIGEPIKLTGKQALRKAVPASSHRHVSQALAWQPQETLNPNPQALEERIPKPRCARIPPCAAVLQRV